MITILFDYINCAYFYYAIILGKSYIFMKYKQDAFIALEGAAF